MSKPLSLSDAVALADDIQHQAKNGVRCTISKIVETLDDSDFVVFRDLMKSDYRHTTVAEVLKTAGYKVSALMIARHRQTNGNSCTCRCLDRDV